MNLSTQLRISIEKGDFMKRENLNPEFGPITICGYVCYVMVAYNLGRLFHPIAGIVLAVTMIAILVRRIIKLRIYVDRTVYDIVNHDTLDRVFNKHVMNIEDSAAISETVVDDVLEHLNEAFTPGEMTYTKYQTVIQQLSENIENINNMLEFGNMPEEECLRLQALKAEYLTALDKINNSLSEMLQLSVTRDDELLKNAEELANATKLYSKVGGVGLDKGR